MWVVLLRYALRSGPLDGGAIKGLIEHCVDEHAKAKVDRLVHCLFSLPWGPSLPGFSMDRSPWYELLEPFEADGQDLARVLLDRCRSHGMEFLVGLRMNDRHQDSAGTRICREHPQWRLNAFPTDRAALDYRHEGVRRPVLTFVEEFLDRYDVDGVELDWMRWCHMFEPGEAEPHAPILTQFMTQMRRVVDRAAVKRGRQKLLLAARVPQTLEECRVLGFDVRAWVQQKLVDFICPSDFFFTDFNLRTEDFVALTDGTDCRVYPSVHPLIAQGNDRCLHRPDSYRAAANNYYAFGAHGISAYNYQYHWRANLGSEDQWPRALSHLTELRDHDAVMRGERRYMFHPLWPAGEPNTGVENHDTIELVRGETSWSAPQRLRMAENISSSRLAATLEFKVTGVAEGDALEVQVNGGPIPSSSIERRFEPDGQSAQEGRGLPAFFRYRMPLESPPAKFGDNELRLRRAGGGGGQTTVAQEFEVLVRDQAKT